MDHVLIDTDVVLDFFFDRKPFSTFATRVLNLCANKEIKGFTAPVIICNVYYMLRKTSKHNIVVEKIKQLLTVIEVIVMNKEVVEHALNSEFKDFEDALQNFSAVDHASITTILTRNIKDYKGSTLAILTPETYLKGR